MHVRPVVGIPEIREGDDIASILETLDAPKADDVVVIASTIVSKAEGRARRLDSYSPGERALEIADRLGERAGEEKDPRFAQAVIEESDEILIDDPFLLTVTHFGHIGVNAGIDRTNIAEGSDILLLPAAPSASAKRIRDNLTNHPPVIISDTCGRPFRYGQRGVAIGWAGIPPTRDWRGCRDRQGRTLHVTVEAIVDELAAAANLVTGESDEGLPVAYIENWLPDTIDGGTALFRSEETDFVRQALRSWRYDTDP